MNLTMGILTAALILCVALSAFFSASETAYAAVNRTRLRARQQEGERRAGLALELAENYDQLLTTILVGNNVVNIAGTSIATVLFTGLVGSMGATLSTVVMTMLVLLFGEVSPKTLAKESPERFAIASARILRASMVVLKPVNRLFAVWRRLLAVLYKPAADDMPIETELMNMVDEAQHEGDMDAHEGELIRSAIEFNDQDALDIMTPRVDVTALADTATMDEAEALFLASAYSRVPVYHEDMDHVVGILNEKDFYEARHAGASSVAEVMMPAVYAPSTLKVSKLLKLFQTTQSHMVVVLDEYGGTEGIVTMEDVLEELVGEIYDEHDDVNEEYVSLADGSVQVDGGMPLTELLDRFGLEDSFEADTVGGWAAEVLGRIPQPGAVFEACGLQGTVTAMERRRVTQVCIRKLDPDAETPDR